MNKAKATHRGTKRTARAHASVPSHPRKRAVHRLQPVAAVITDMDPPDEFIQERTEVNLWGRLEKGFLDVKSRVMRAVESIF
jgi:hypothetical protein